MQSRPQRATDRPGVRERARGVLLKHMDRAKAKVQEVRDRMRSARPGSDDRGMASRPVVQGRLDRRQAPSRAQG